MGSSNFLVVMKLIVYFLVVMKLIVYFGLPSEWTV